MNLCMTAGFWERRVVSYISMFRLPVFPPRALNGIYVCEARFASCLLTIGTDGETTSLAGFLSTSNHLAPDNAQGIVQVTTDAPIYWTVELQPDSQA